MHQGYYIEKDLEYQADVYRQTFSSSHESDEPSALQKEVEGQDVKRENVLVKAVLMNLREGVRDYVRHECQGCRIDHPS